MKLPKAASAAGGVALLIASAALAAAKEPAAPELKGSFPLGAVVCSLVAVAGVCVVGFKNAKRKQPE